MKRINIKSVLQARHSLTPDSFNGFLKYYDIVLRAAEIDDLRILVTALSDAGCSVSAFDRFYVGYKIPQIGKEFDLLRFGPDSILNIELKSSCSEDKIKQQLRRNKYYLGFLGRVVFAFTFVAETRNLYFLRDDGELVRTSLDNLVKLLGDQAIDDVAAPDSLFDPSDYLVSPFNSTERFLDGEYFLTHQQEEIQSLVIDSINESSGGIFISIAGSAGTGKTLLVYDIARQLAATNKKTLIIHCGQLNSGHLTLIKDGWHITAIKDYNKYDLEDYDLVVVDEAQRIRPAQLEVLIGRTIAAKACCIFSHDKLQTLADWEAKRDVSGQIAAIRAIKEYKLSEKIRTNKEIAAFIKMLFNNKLSLPMSGAGNIEVNYFDSEMDAKNYLDFLDESKWEVLRFTPSQYNKEQHERYAEISNRTSHQVIGQEFDRVAVTIDRLFSYADNGDLIYKGDTYYDPPKMLFQNITRARKKLNIVIIGNEELLNRCLTILQ